MTGAYDVAVIGAGTAGLPTAIEAGARGLKVCVIEATDRIGGTLHVSAGQMSAAGTRLQAARGIADTPDRHYADAMHICRHTADPALMRLAVDLAAGTIDWLMDRGFAMDPACPAVVHLHESYRAARTYWGVEGGRSILAVLTPLFEAARARDSVDLLLHHRATALLTGPVGAVTGVRAVGPDGTPQDIRAAQVVLATGGYGANAAMFSALTGGRPLYSCAMPASAGAALEMAGALGAQLRGAEHFLPTMGGVEDPSGSGRVIWEDVPLLTPQARPPWEIYVNRRGARFVAEDHDSVDARERALLAEPDLTFWIVSDARAARAAPPLFPRWSRDRLEAAFRDHPAFVQADTLDAVARRAGLPPAALVQTVAVYNRSVAARHDDLGRRHLPAPIDEPPFRAIRAHGIVLRTWHGVAVASDLRVLREDGTAISGLYAIGEALGGGALSGNAFVGGMSVTPALSFGRWLGQRLGGA